MYISKVFTPSTFEAILGQFICLCAYKNMNIMSVCLFYGGPTQ
jgi:hypothetical protein